MLSVAKYSELEELDSVILDTFLPTGKRATQLVYGRIVSNPFTKSAIPTFPGFNMTIQEVPAGNGNGAHVHKNTEIFVFLDGEWEIGYGYDAKETAELKGGDLIVVPAWECRTYQNTGPRPGHILTILAGESWVQFDQKVIEEARKYGAICDDWGTLTHDLEGRPIKNLNAEHKKEYRRKEDFVVTSPREMANNIFRQTGKNGKVKMPSVPEKVKIEMVTVPQNTSVRVPLRSLYTTVVGLEGRGLVQGIQILGKWDTALVQNVEGVSEPEVRLEGLDYERNTFLVVYSEEADF